jgi:hypothetical protein
MSTAVLTPRLGVNPLADKALKAAAAFWFLVAVIGQWMFVLYIVTFYGRLVVKADVALLNRVLFRGYIAGDHLGNFALALHIFLAAVITVGGPLQLIPQIRTRLPRFHRWNGRIYLLTAFTTSIAALYLVWIRRSSPGGLVQHVGTSIGAVLIMFCGAMALRYALASRLQNSSPLGPSPFPGGECILVPPGGVDAVASHF